MKATCDWCNGKLSVTVKQVVEHMRSGDGKEEYLTGQSTPRQLKLKEEELQAVPSPGSADWS